MKANTRLLFGLLSSLSVVSFIHSQSTSDLINDQVASHFEQVFSDKTAVHTPVKTSWVPGNDKDTQVLGSVWNLDVSMTRVFETGIDDLPGHDVSVDYIEAGISVSAPLKPRHKLSLALNSTLYRIDEVSHGFSNELQLEKAETFDAGFLYRMGLNPRWELMAGGGASFTDSDNVAMGGKTTILGYAGAVYTFNPNLTIAFAIPFTSREYLDHGPFPLFVLDWRIDDRNRLLVSNGVKYSYALTRDWRHVLGFRISGTSLTLHMDDQVINGEMRYNPAYVIYDTWAGLTYSYTFQNGMVFTSNVDLIHSGSHGYWDNDEAFDTTEFEPSPGLSFGLSYRF